MEYLGLALYAEGPTDYYFLRPLLRRLCGEICLRDARRPVELSDVLSLDHPSTFADADRDRRVVEAARESAGSWRILFVHTDGGGNAATAHRERIAPALRRLSLDLPEVGEGVGVVPVREIESWVLADGDALRRVFGLSSTDEQLGIALKGRELESEQDPKRLLQSVFEATRPAARMRRRGVSPFLDPIGEEISIDRLRALPSFTQLEGGLREALRRLAIVE